MTNWYEDHLNLATLARYMADQGDDASTVAYMLEKPWKYEGDWRRANLRVVKA